MTYTDQAPSPNSSTDSSVSAATENMGPEAYDQGSGSSRVPNQHSNPVSPPSSPTLDLTGPPVTVERTSREQWFLTAAATVMIAGLLALSWWATSKPDVPKGDEITTRPSPPVAATSNVNRRPPKAADPNADNSLGSGDKSTKQSSQTEDSNSPGAILPGNAPGGTTQTALDSRVLMEYGASAFSNNLSMFRGKFAGDSNKFFEQAYSNKIFEESIGRSLTKFIEASTDKEKAFYQAKEFLGVFSETSHLVFQAELKKLNREASDAGHLNYSSLGNSDLQYSRAQQVLEIANKELRDVSYYLQTGKFEDGKAALKEKARNARTFVETP